MMVIFIILVVAGVEVAATTPPKEPQGRCPIAPMECGPNSHYEKCSKICPPQNCSYLIDTHWLCENPGCKPECRCNDGFYRNQNGTCISRDECLAQCGPLERYVSDYSYCRRTCANYKVTAPRSLCKPYSGCVCEEGRVRLNDDATGPCVLLKDCTLPICNKPNEVAKDCGSHCEIWICEDYNRTDVVSSTVCVRGCYCREGYARNAYGDCIRKEKCPPPTCRKNEKYMTCGTACPITCDNFEDPPKVCTQQCIAGCFCKEGYVRNLKDNTCTKPEHCPTPTCRKNEKYMTCGTACPITCDNFKDPPKVCTQQCIEGCFCKEGYVRNLKDNTCTKPKHCPPPTCRENEKYTTCGTACPITCDGLKCLNINMATPTCRENEKYMTCGTACPITCENFKEPPKVCTQQCIEGCFCKEGYVRNLKDNTCTKAERCPPTCRENEKYMTCGTACPITCDNFKNPPKVCTQQCIEGCFCKAGYVKNRLGRCVKPEQCEPTCPAGEKWNECSAHCQDTCENYNSSNRVCTYKCQSGCVCEQGKVRRKDGRCVRPTECTDNITCPTDEVYDQCSAHCEPTCEHHGPDRACTAICKPGCRCREGLVRRKDKKCVKLDQCSGPICPANEEYDTCIMQKCPPGMMCAQVCSPGCRCKDGYVRDKKGQCVTKNIVCPPNEVLSECYNSCHTTCKTRLRGDGRMCHLACIETGCLCKEGYLRHDNGTCVPIRQCSLPRCNDNETYSKCGTACPPTCQNRGDNCTACTKQCVEDCFCNKGLVRSDDGKCIKLKDCPARICGSNEKLDMCPPTCPPTDGCSNMWSKFNCTNAIKCCKPQCRCKPGYLRKDKVCVPIKQCLN